MEPGPTAADVTRCVPGAGVCCLSDYAPPAVAGVRTAQRLGLRRSPCPLPSTTPDAATAPRRRRGRLAVGGGGSGEAQRCRCGCGGARSDGGAGGEKGCERPSHALRPVIAQFPRRCKAAFSCLHAPIAAQIHVLHRGRQLRACPCSPDICYFELKKLTQCSSANTMHPYPGPQADVAPAIKQQHGVHKQVQRFHKGPIKCCGLRRKCVRSRQSLLASACDRAATRAAPALQMGSRAAGAPQRCRGTAPSQRLLIPLPQGCAHLERVRACKHTCMLGEAQQVKPPQTQTADQCGRARRTTPFFTHWPIYNHMLNWARGRCIRQKGPLAASGSAQVRHPYNGGTRTLVPPPGNSHALARAKLQRRIPARMQPRTRARLLVWQPQQG